MGAFVEWLFKGVHVCASQSSQLKAVSAVFERRLNLGPHRSLIANHGAGDFDDSFPHLKFEAHLHEPFSQREHNLNFKLVPTSRFHRESIILTEKFWRSRADTDHHCLS